MIVTRLRNDESNPMTDYFSSKSVSTVIGGFSCHTRDLFSEIRICCQYAFEKYEVIDGVRVRRGNETKDWWGPINAGVTLVWKLF